MPPGGRSRRACGGRYAAGLPRPWPDGRAQPLQQESKVDYLKAGARPMWLLLPSPFREHPRSSKGFGVPGSPANIEETDDVNHGKRHTMPEHHLISHMLRTCILKINQAINFLFICQSTWISTRISTSKHKQVP